VHGLFPDVGGRLLSQSGRGCEQEEDGDSR